MTDQPPATFAARVVAWQHQHGRHDLPWQNTRDPYRVWLSEIMLQQTQVSTVVGYFQRFLQRFPDVLALEQGQLDEVLGLWSGLGYYSRARNLHLCAQTLVAQHQGVFPRSAEQLAKLPGIGRSTAAAIASLCFDERVAILDGNVRRVLARVEGYDKDLSATVHERGLWSLACARLPVPSRQADMPVYTQALMDLGATVCTRTRPRCGDCPVQEICTGHATGAPERFPVKSRKLKRSAESHWLLLAVDSAGRTWLHKRPDRGIWASLYSLPMFSERVAALGGLASLSGGHIHDVRDAPAFVHVLTHKDLHLHPVLVRLASSERLTPE
ncbi:MAG: A/G-specific adenine glycosylase, partial [Pseudomonadota bacterium]